MRCAGILPAKRHAEGMKMPQCGAANPVAPHHGFKAVTLVDTVVLLVQL